MILRRTRYLNARHLSAGRYISSEADAVFVKPGDLWYAKVISTVFALSPPSTASVRLAPFIEDLSPSTASFAIRRLRDPKLSLAFFEITRSDFGVRHLVASYRSLIGNFCYTGQSDAALKVFDEMLVDGHTPTATILEVLVRSYSRAGELDAAVGLLRRAYEYNCRVRSYAYNKVIDRLMMTDRVHDGVQFFREQLSSPVFTPDTCSFNIVIKGLCRIGDIERAFEFFNDMGKFHCSPDAITHNSLIHGLCKTNQVGRGREFLLGIQMSGLCPPNAVTYTSIIRGYCKRGEMKEAFGLFSEMISSGIRPSNVTYNVLIDGYSKAGDMVLAVSIYENMIASGCFPDKVTYTSLIDGYCRIMRIDDALKLWDEMKMKNLWPNAHTFAIIINALCKQNRIGEAQAFLMKMKGRDIVAQPFMFNPVIDGLCKIGNVDEANFILAEMENMGCFPDKITYTILIIGHCMKGRMPEAIFIFHKMIMTGCEPDSLTVTSLTTCLLKAGMPNEASRILGALEKNKRWYLPSLKKPSPEISENLDVSVAA